MPLSRIAPKRKLVQWLTTLVLLGLPFMRAGGESLLRLDAASRTLFFFGAKVRIEEFYLFLLVLLLFVFAFLFVTMVFGRVWCGWLCPQTTLTDLAEFIDRVADAAVSGHGLRRVVKHLGYLVLAVLVAANLVWYFIPPCDFFPRLVGGKIGMVAGITLVSSVVLIYGDLVLVRRWFCTEACPYGRIQLLTMDRNTLTLEYDPRRAHLCIRCGACERACPMGIDIRDGLQVECINCGRCLDACREVMARRGGEGLIHYTFGRKDEGGGRPINGRSLLLAGIVLLLGGALALGIATRKDATIKVERGAGEVRRLADGALLNHFAAYLENRAGTAASFALTVTPVAGYRVELLGPVTGLRLAANANRRVDFMVKVTPAFTAPRWVELRLVRDGRIVAATPLPIQVR